VLAGNDGTRRSDPRRGWWLLVLPVVACILGAVAFVAGPSSTYLDAEVKGTSLTRTDRLAASEAGGGASSTTAGSPHSAGDAIDDLIAPTTVPAAIPPVDPVTTAPSVTAAPTSAPPSTVAPIVAPPLTAPVQAAAVDLPSQVLARISYPWQTRLPGWRIEFVGARAGYRGSTFPNDRLMQIYVRPDESLDELAHVTAHEMGHAVDVTFLDQADRSSFNIKRGRPGDATWWVANGADDFSSGAGDWAECFAWYQMQSGPWYSRLGNPPDAATLGLVEALAR